jgi:hypothetical protein
MPSFIAYVPLCTDFRMAGTRIKIIIPNGRVALPHPVPPL